METAALNATIGAGSQYSSYSLAADRMRVYTGYETAQANAGMASSIAGGGTDFVDYATAPTTTFEGQTYRWWKDRWIKG